MPKLPNLRPRELIKIFQKFGFVVDRQSGSHVILYSSQFRRRIVIPMHVKDVPSGTLRAIVKQSGLTKDKFIQRIK